MVPDGRIPYQNGEFRFRGQFRSKALIHALFMPLLFCPERLGRERAKQTVRADSVVTTFSHVVFLRVPARRAVGVIVPRILFGVGAPRCHALAW